jgi:hypothetical protein
MPRCKAFEEATVCGGRYFPVRRRRPIRDKAGILCSRRITERLAQALLRGWRCRVIDCLELRFAQIRNA